MTETRARVVIVENGAVALIERVRDGRTYYLFPGGGVDEGETPEAAAVLEAREELGVDVVVGDAIHAETFDGARFLYFAAEIAGGEFGAGAWPDHAAVGERERLRRGTYEAVWVPLGDLANVEVGLDVRPHELVRRLLQAK